MSRQINFYMDKKTEEQFLHFVINNGFIVFDRYGKQLDILECKDTFVFLTKINYISYVKYRNDNIDILNSLAIELTRSNIDKDRQRVKRGRLYISDACKELQYIDYMNDFIKNYNILYRWIKKYIPYQYYKNKGVQLKGYINDTMLEYSEKGYQFL